uniref:(northern house mosquito) hypothetical protein n=1 Tax=Culex pipiens TaxID=7175 RepID=A0A8D8FPH7_CULPI
MSSQIFGFLNTAESLPVPAVSDSDDELRQCFESFATLSITLMLFFSRHERSPSLLLFTQHDVAESSRDVLQQTLALCRPRSLRNFRTSWLLSPPPRRFSREVLSTGCTGGLSSDLNSSTFSNELESLAVFSRVIKLLARIGSSNAALLHPVGHSNTLLTLVVTSIVLPSAEPPQLHSHFFAAFEVVVVVVVFDTSVFIIIVISEVLVVVTLEGASSVPPRSFGKVPSAITSLSVLVYLHREAIRSLSSPNGNSGDEAQHRSRS